MLIRYHKIAATTPKTGNAAIRPHITENHRGVTVRDWCRPRALRKAVWCAMATTQPAIERIKKATLRTKRRKPPNIDPSKPMTREPKMLSSERNAPIAIVPIPQERSNIWPLRVFENVTAELRILDSLDCCLDDGISNLYYAADASNCTYLF